MIPDLWPLACRFSGHTSSKYAGFVGNVLFPLLAAEYLSRSGIDPSESCLTITFYGLYRKLPYAEARELF
jgi:hypothetical protein